jgi:hypothetical protein
VEDAQRVYRALVKQHPGDARLAARLAVLEGRDAEVEEPGPTMAGTARVGQTAMAFLRSLFHGDAVPALPQVPTPGPAGTSGDAGTVLDDAFESGEDAVGSPASSGADGGDGAGIGAPTQPARDAFSLDAVFGEGSRESETLPALEPEPAQAAPRPSGFSFDEFFGGGGAGGSGEAGGDSAAGVGDRGSGPAPAGRGPGRASRGGEPEEDLDQFQAWLRGLKT